MLWVPEVPNHDNIVVKYLQTLFHGVAPKVPARLECLPVSYSDREHPRRTFSLVSLFSPKLKEDILEGDLKGEDRGYIRYGRCNVEGDTHSLCNASDVKCCLILEISFNIFRRLVDECNEATVVSFRSCNHGCIKNRKEYRFHVPETATYDIFWAPAAIRIGAKQSLSSDSSLRWFTVASSRISPFSMASAFSLFTSKSSLVNTTTSGTVNA